jgi:hypothetical protein
MKGVWPERRDYQWAHALDAGPLHAYGAFLGTD